MPEHFLLTQRVKYVTVNVWYKQKMFVLEFRF